MFKTEETGQDEITGDFRSEYCKEGCIVKVLLVAQLFFVISELGRVCIFVFKPLGLCIH